MVNPEQESRPGDGAPLVLLFDTYPDGFYGAQRTLFELATAGTGEPSSFRSLAMVIGEGPVAQRLRGAGVEVEVEPVLRGRLVRRSSPTPIRRLTNVLSYAIYNVRIFRLIRRKGVDVVYCSNTRSVLTIGAASRLARRPVVWYVQIENTLGWFDRLAARLATHVVVLATSVDRLLDRRVRSIAAGRTSSIVLGGPPVTVEPARDTGSRGRLRVALVGSIGPRKGQHLLIEALALIPADLDVVARIVGDVPVDGEQYAARLHDSVATAGLGEAVEFTGWTDRVDRVLADTDVLVVPSAREGLPRVIMEAMAAGVAVIATDVGAVRDLVIDGVTGTLLPTRDPAAIAEAIAAMALEPDRAVSMGRAGREHLRRAFSGERYRREFTDLFRTLAGR